MIIWGKSIKRILIVWLILISMIIVFESDLSVIIRIRTTERTVEKGKFSNVYFIEANNEEVKMEEFKKFMLLEGWNFSETYNETIIFRKGNLQKEIPLDRLIGI